MIFLWEKKLGVDMIKICCIHTYCQRINKSILKKNVGYQLKHPEFFLGIRLWKGCPG